MKLINSKWKERGIKNVKEALKFLSSYKWSSCLDYLEIIRPENKIINRVDFLNYFNSKNSFQDEIFEWINIRLEEDG